MGSSTYPNALSPIKIYFQDLEVILETIFENITKQFGEKTIKLDKDYYFCVDLNETEVLCSQLYDDWGFLEPLLSEPEYAVGILLDFHLAPLLRYIAYEFSNATDKKSTTLEKETVLDIKKSISISFDDLKKITSILLRGIENEVDQNYFELRMDTYFYISLKEAYENILTEDWPTAKTGSLYGDWKGLECILSNPNDGTAIMLDPFSHLLKYLGSNVGLYLNQK